MPVASWYERNKEQQKATNKIWREANREYDRQRKREWYRKEGRKRDLAKKYGLTPEEYTNILTSQGDHCAICPSTHMLSVDHNHTTGEVRGILCYDCNRNFIGNYEDGAKFHLAANYLDGKREKIT